MEQDRPPVTGRGNEEAELAEGSEHPVGSGSRSEESDVAGDLAREVYWAGDGVSRLTGDFGLLGERLDTYAHQLRVAQRQLVPADKALLGSAAGWKHGIKLFIWRLTRFSTMRYDRLLADLAEMNGQLARRLFEMEEELARLREDFEGPGGSGP
jgi:hypothetical protein